MISERQIARLVEFQEYRQLVDRILSNGRCRSRAAQRILNHPEAAAPAALGLALQRISEITYGPTEAACALSRSLIAMQRRDGLFTVAQHPSLDCLLASTAAALRGLISFVEQHRSTALMIHSPMVQAMDECIALGMAALACLFRSGENVNTNAAGWAIVLWQLGDDARFRAAVPAAELLAMLENSSDEVVEDELCRYAHAMAA